MCAELEAGSGCRLDGDLDEPDARSELDVGRLVAAHGDLLRVRSAAHGHAARGRRDVLTRDEIVSGSESLETHLPLVVGDAARNAVRAAFDDRATGATLARRVIPDN